MNGSSDLQRSGETVVMFTSPGEAPLRPISGVIDGTPIRIADDEDVDVARRLALNAAVAGRP